MKIRFENSEINIRHSKLLLEIKCLNNGKMQDYNKCFIYYERSARVKRNFPTTSHIHISF